MSTCLIPPQVEGREVKSCDNGCYSSKEESYAGHFMAGEIREIYEILVYNRKKIDILMQINTCIKEALDADNEVFVK